MKIKAVTAIKSKDEARQEAIDWQDLASEQSLSYSELAEWQGYFMTLGKKYGLSREFKENGIL